MNFKGISILFSFLRSRVQILNRTIEEHTLLAIFLNNDLEIWMTADLHTSVFELVLLLYLGECAVCVETNRNLFGTIFFGENAQGSFGG